MDTGDWMMDENWVLKVYLDNRNKRKRRKTKRICRRRSMKLQGNCYVKYYMDKPKRLMRKLEHKEIKFSFYRMEYERSSNYRQRFFASTQEPYRCRYCHRRLSKEKVFIDHIIPVAKAQKNKGAKHLLKLKRCENVNSLRNLAPACKKCNSRKSDKMGLWVLRGWLGKYRLYWLFVRLFQCACLYLLLIGILRLTEWFSQSAF